MLPFAFALARLLSAGYLCCAGGIHCSGMCCVGVFIVRNVVDCIIRVVAHAAMTLLPSTQYCTIVTLRWHHPVACHCPQHDSAITHVALALSSCPSSCLLQRPHGPCRKAAVAHAMLDAQASLPASSKHCCPCCGGIVTVDAHAALPLLAMAIVALVATTSLPGIIPSSGWHCCPCCNGIVAITHLDDAMTLVAMAP